MQGQDIRISPEGSWPSFVAEDNKMHVSAVPIKHTVPCVGFIFEEPPRPGSVDAATYIPMLDRNKKALSQPPYNLGNPRQLLRDLKMNMKPITLPDGSVMEPPAMHVNGRKIVLLGDTYEAESEEMDKHAMDADLVVHEATNAFLPGLDDAIKDGDTYQDIYKKCRQHGHSTPQVRTVVTVYLSIKTEIILQVAGQFAKRIRAKNLFLNHLSARYIDVGTTLQPDEQDHVKLDDQISVICTGLDRTAEVKADGEKERSTRMQCLKKIEEQATETWEADRRAIVTRDFMSVIVRRRKG